MMHKGLIGMLILGAVALVGSPTGQLNATVSCNTVEGGILSENIVSGQITECFTPISITLQDVGVLNGGTLRLGSMATIFEPEISVDKGAVLQVLGPPLLNDTGIANCGDVDDNDLGCPVTEFPNQDAQHGRDVTHPSNADGYLGFSFTKLDTSGVPLSAQSSSWSCVRDKITDLIWEVKTDNGGLMDMDSTFTWYNTDSNTNGGNVGIPGGGTCTGGIVCDTQAYVSAVNSAGLCGANDWRMPTPEELLSIINFSIENFTGPSIDENFFPNTIDRKYWSATSQSFNSVNAWVVDFFNGKVLSIPKSTTSPDVYARLVRGGK